MPARFVFAHPIDVRFRDCDPRGHVNNAAYHTYLEESRLALWRDLFGEGGLPGVGTILARTEIDFLAPASAHDRIDVRVGIAHLGRSSIAMDYEIVRAGGGARLASARAVIVTFDYAANRSMPVPPVVRARLEALRDAPPVQAG
ncbi:MAG: acyl-CoA thioesterase [Acidobacteria bacterium]|nr:acyl-CoA thioesterase [Acidobacteriota bacterium]